jgi:hypothetical protein
MSNEINRLRKHFYNIEHQIKNRLENEIVFFLKFNLEQFLFSNKANLVYIQGYKHNTPSMVLYFYSLLSLCLYTQFEKVFNIYDHLIFLKIQRTNSKW